MTLNIANTVLILGCLYFIYTYGFSWWLVFLIIFALGTWLYNAGVNEQKDLLKARAEYYRAKAEYYKERKK